MTIREKIRDAWRGIAGEEQNNIAGPAGAVQAAASQAARRTAPLPSILTQHGSVVQPGALPRPTAANLRRFAETPLARRAINVVKDRIACMDWQVRVRRGHTADAAPDTEAKLAAVRRALEEPNAADSFRTLWEQVLEDVLVGGFGAAEMALTGDAAQPFTLWPVDGAQVSVDPKWSGDPETPRYGFRTGLSGLDVTPLRDDQLVYIRLNPRTHTAFGLGRLEVAFESIGQFLSANRYAGRLASNSVVQYALWLDEATPEQHDRLIRWWQDEIEGTGRVPVLSSEKKPEVLRFAGGTDADLRLAWQEFLLRMIANAFELPPMLLGLAHDVNKSTADALAEEAFRSAIVPVAKLLAEHITRDIFGKLLGWREFEFAFTELDVRDPQTDVAMQLDLLRAGVLTVDEVRQQLGRAPLAHDGALAGAEAGGDR